MLDLPMDLLAEKIGKREQKRAEFTFRWKALHSGRGWPGIGVKTEPPPLSRPFPPRRFHDGHKLRKLQILVFSVYFSCQEQKG